MTDENPYNVNKGQYLACPSCGSDVICYSESNDRLVCDSCGCSMREDHWNTRVYPAEITEKADGDIDPAVVADKMLNDHLCRLYDQIMHLPCVVPVQLMTRNDIQIYGWGYVTARKAAADLVAEIKEGKEGE